MLNENSNEQKSTKDAKCLLNKKFYSPTIRITVSLREPDEESCSVFNYISLITEEVRSYMKVEIFLRIEYVLNELRKLGNMRSYLLHVHYLV